MIFSENPYDRSIERLMTQIPNFKPRGGGLFFSKLKLTKQSCSCTLCPNYKKKLFFKWGIEFDEKNPYRVPEHGNRKVEYAEKKEILDGIKAKYPKPEDSEYTDSDKAASGRGQDLRQTEHDEPTRTQPHNKPKDRGKGGTGLTPERNRTFKEAITEVKTDGQT